MFTEADAGKAAYLISIRDAEAVEPDAEVPAPSAGMVVHADPVVQVRDPVAARKGRRRS